MAKTIPQLTDATTVNAADELIIQQGGITKRATGAELAAGLNSINGMVNIRDFGAVGDGVADDTAAIQAAIDTGKTVFLSKGNYRVNNQLNVSTLGQLICGQGRGVSIITVGPTFNLSADAVFNITIKEPGPEFKNFAIKFEQPTTSLRGDLIAYPPAILAHPTGSPRITIDCIRISNAMTALNLRGNSGGCNLNNCELSAYEKHIVMDGCLDVVQINNIRCWPFDMPVTNHSIFFGEQTIGIDAGRVDGLLISNSMFICGLQINIHAGSLNIPGFGIISDCEFDGYNGLKLNGGIYSLSNSFFSNQIATFESVEIVRGNLVVSNCHFLTGSGVGGNFIVASSNSGGLVAIVVDNCFFDSSSNDLHSVYANTTMGGVKLIVSNCYFRSAVNTNYTKAKVYAGQNVQALITGNQIDDKGTGSGDFINVVDAAGDTVSNNIFAGYTLSAPANLSGIHIAQNLQVGAASGGSYQSGQIVGVVSTKIYQGTLNGSGNAIFAHGLSAANLRTIMWSVMYEDTGSIIRPMNLSYIDGGNVSITGGAASAKYKVYLTFTETQLPW